MQRIDLQGVSVTLGDKQILHNIDVTFTGGNVECLLGPNSAGKSVLARTICLLHSATTGKIYWDDELVSSERPDRIDLIRRTSYMGQKPVFLKGSVRENISFPLKIQGKENNELVDEYLELFGLSDLASKDPRILSGGMQQKVSLVRALVTDPELLILDEPTASIEPETKLWMEETILSLQKRSNFIIIWITHDIAQAMRISRRITVIKSGYIVFNGSRSEALTSDLFKEQRKYLDLQL